MPKNSYLNALLTLQMFENLKNLNKILIEFLHSNIVNFMQRSYN